MELNKVIIHFGGVEGNCLNTIRLLAAIEVLYGHTLWHLGIDEIPILGYFIHFFSGVPVFFTMSGFLIWWSLGRSKCFGEYLRKRFWRIYPELWVAVIFELIVLLCLYNDPVNWLQFGAFAITQSSIFQFWTPDCLRNYGCGCPNGSLWTIGVLIQFYFLAYFMYKYLHGRKTWMWLVSFISAIGVSMLLPILQENIPYIVGKLLNQTLLPYLWMFVVASFVAEKKDMFLPFLKRYWWLLLYSVLIVKYARIDLYASYNVLETILLFSCLTGFAYAFPNLNIKTDISYGVYIYHMTIVNALIAMRYTNNPVLLVVVLVSTCVLAWISTKTVGEFSKRMKSKL